jgi:histone-lysine N-methyltransferase SETD1
VLQGDPSPPPDPRLAIAGYTTGEYVVNTGRKTAPKSKLRLAPYIAKPYAFDPKISCGPDPATQVVVTGFDPLTPESQLRAFFTVFGDIEYVRNQVHPNTGSPLGICLVKFRDTHGSRKTAGMKASTSAKRAEKEGTKQRIGLQEVRVQIDREGRRCSRLVARIVDQTRKEEEKLRAKFATKSTIPSTPITSTMADLPANVPKGPSGKGNGMRPSIAAALPQQMASRKPIYNHLIESAPIKPSMKRTPYIFIAHQYVPVLGTTIDHLKKRLKSYQWTGVRCDRTGYYVAFDDSRRGEEEAVKCFKECHMNALFTYVMNMECQPYGDPDYERSPSPERVMENKKRQAEEERTEKEEAEDLEFEKRQRADELDPVRAALEMLREDVQTRLLEDIRTRISGPALFDLMAPERHEAKRRKLNISEPQAKDDVRRSALITPGLDSPAHGTSLSRASGFSGGRFGRDGRKTLHNRIRDKKPSKPINVYGDERRKAPPKRNNVRGLHHALLLDDDKDSDDEAQSTITRDTEEQESRPISRAPSTDVDEEESSRGLRAKRRRIEAGWGDDSDDEVMMDDSHARSLLAHCIHKDPENMAEKELEQVLAILPRSSPIWKKADKALKGFRRLRLIEQEADAIFGVETTAEDKPEPEVIITNDDEEPLPTTEMETAKAAKKKPTVPKSKRKTKKQLREEAKAAQASAIELPQEAMLPEVDDGKAMSAIPAPSLEESPEGDHTFVRWSVSILHPRPTVEDDLSVVMDIDGWQHMLKDEEDLALLKNALESTSAAKISDAQSWARKQKQIKHLNRRGEEGVCRTETKIEGYYRPNSTGSARTQGVEKIRESIKSLYLPHRIKVQKEREARERQAKQDEGRTTTVVEGFKFTSGSKATSTANSRANRANNRRLVNDMTISKNQTGAEGDAMRFNQLMKRKKLVKFDRSAIHNWGLYTLEDISANDMIIEYVGEKVRQRVADLREVKYDMQGVGSSYLFRIDEDTVIDATKMGGIARFINHSCMPNCTAKIIRVEGTKRIVIYALRDIRQGKTCRMTLYCVDADDCYRRRTHVRLQIRA